MTRCACERDGNPIPSPVTQQQRGDKGGKLFIKVSLDCCNRAAPARRVLERRDAQAPGTQPANRQQQRGNRRSTKEVQGK